MATVAELKAQADDLGITYRSKTLKWELERMIALAIEAREGAPVAQVDDSTPEAAESVAEASAAEDAPDLSVPTWSKAELAHMAGEKGKSAEPMGDYSRLCAYVDQRRLANESRSTLACRSLLTPRQNRRMEKKKANRTKASV